MFSYVWLKIFKNRSTQFLFTDVFTSLLFFFGNYSFKNCSKLLKFLLIIIIDEFQLSYNFQANSIIFHL